jgi:hypothetical protein
MKVPGHREEYIRPADGVVNRLAHSPDLTETVLLLQRVVPG